MSYNKEINSFMKANKGKDISVEMPSHNLDSCLGRYCTVLFNIDGVEHPYVLSIAMLLSILQNHVTECKKERLK